MTAAADRTLSRASSPRAAEALDPVTVEVIRRRLVAIADEVDVNITRTAFSPYIYEYKDYAVGVVDASGDLICQCTAAMPVFVADVMRAAVHDGLKLYGPENFHDGDVIITNYAGTVGQHLNNVVMYTPVYAPQQAVLIGFMVVVMHWIDVGGRDIGSTSKFATDIFQEGIQFRTVKLRSRGEPVLEMYRMIEHNTRFPVEMMGDINSQIGGCLMGRDEISDLVGRYGVGVFRAALDTIWDQSEAASRAAIRAIPDGRYTAEGILDDDGLHPESLPCKVTVIVEGDEMTIDLSEVAPEVNAPMNSGRSGGGETVSRLAFRYLVMPEGDANEGTFRPLKLILPEGTIISAKPTAPMGSYNSALPTLIDLVIRALGPAIPDRVAAGHFGTFSTLAFAGRWPESGLFWQCHDSGFGGWGALIDQDGPGPFRTNCHGDTRMIPIEVHEASYPFMIESFGLRTDSGGPGEFRGGLGLTRRYLMLAPCRMSTRFERTKCPPWGLNGGGDGEPGNVLIEAADGTTRTALKDAVFLQAGDRVRVQTGGGGGFGDPRKRSRDRLRTDLVRGYVSPEAAQHVYGWNEESAESKFSSRADHREKDMAKLRHIAIAAEDPYATAEFYKQAFDFEEVHRTHPAGEGKSYGVFLSDGTLNMAILHFGWDQGQGLDFRGIHHFGVLVDDVDSYADRLEELGAKCFARRPEGQQGFYETKFHGPDKVVFDITDHPWRGAAPLGSDEKK